MRFFISTEKDDLTGSSLALDVMAFALTIFIFGLLPALKWLRLFPLVEFRQKIFRENGFDFLMDNWTLRGSHMFSTAEVFDNWVGRTCDLSIPCLNAFPLLIHLVTATALFVVARRALDSRLVAAISTALWTTSVPYLDTLAWQALNLDKFAALTTTSGTLVGLYFFRKQYSTRNIVLTNLLLLGLVLVGYNAKPSAWVLIPGLWLIPMTGNGMRFRQWTMYLILPTLYGVAHNLHWYQAVQADSFYREHTSSGDPIMNLNKFLGFLHGSSIPTLTSRITFVVLMSILFVGAIRRRPISRFGLWCVFMVLGGMVIAIRTQHGSPFYMLVSQIFYALAFGAVLTEALQLAKEHAWKGRLVLLTSFIALMLIFLPGIRKSYLQYSTVLIQSDNFQDSFELINEIFTHSSTHQFKIVFVIEEIMDYKYLDGGMLRPFMPSGFPIEESMISWELKSDFESSLRATDAVYFLYDNDMTLEEILKPSAWPSL